MSDAAATASADDSRSLHPGGAGVRWVPVPTSRQAPSGISALADSETYAAGPETYSGARTGVPLVVVIDSPVYSAPLEVIVGEGIAAGQPPARR
jgi:hypothetical protein